MKKSYELKLKLVDCDILFQDASGADMGPGILASCIVDFTLASEKDLEGPRLAAALARQMNALKDRTVEVLVEPLP